MDQVSVQVRSALRFAVKLQLVAGDTCVQVWRVLLLVGLLRLGLDVDAPQRRRCELYRAQALCAGQLRCGRRPVLLPYTQRLLLRGKFMRQAITDKVQEGGLAF